MALFKVFRGQSSNLSSQPKKDGYAYFCTDDGSFWIDYEDGNHVLQRKQVGENVFLKNSVMINDSTEVTFNLPTDYSTAATETLATREWIEQMILGGEW